MADGIPFSLHLPIAAGWGSAGAFPNAADGNDVTQFRFVRLGLVLLVPPPGPASRLPAVVPKFWLRECERAWTVRALRRLSNAQRQRVWDSREAEGTLRSWAQHFITPSYFNQGLERYWRNVVKAFLRTELEFSRSIVSDSMRPHGLQNARPPFHHQRPEFTQTHVH